MAARRSELSSGTGIRRLRPQVQQDRVPIDAEGADALTYARWQRRATLQKSARRARSGRSRVTP